jgi:predicted outer membrane repeat protein
MTIPSISAENIDDDILNEDLNSDLGLDLGSEEVDIISDSNIASADLADENSNSNSDDSSQELISRIENANNGDTILIEPGTYKVHGINITKNISLQGNGDPRDIIIDGERLSTIFFIQDIGITAKFNNLTLINGKTDNFGGGICIETGNAYVDNCIFINNTALNVTNGGAISNYGNDTDRSYLFVNNSLFIGNHADHDGGAVTTCYASSDIYNSVFINNSAHRDGGAIRVSVFGYGNVQDCIFMYNHADEWAGAYYSWAGNSSIDRCIFINNTAGTNGGAVMVSGSLNLTNSIIVNNTADETGGSFYIQQPMFNATTVINVNNNIITNNSSPLGQEVFVKWPDAKYLFPKFNDNDWGSEDPTDSSVLDPNNVSNRIKPTSTKNKMGLFDLLDFSLLNRYSDVLQDYYGRDYDEHFERFNSNDDGLKFDDNKTGADNSNGKSDDGGSSSLIDSLNKQSNAASGNSLNNQSKTANSNSAGVKSDDVNSTYVSENSNNRKMVELFEDDPISQKSFDIRYALVLAIVLLIFAFGLLRKRDRSN